MYSKSTTHISLNGSHFLTARRFWCTEHIRSVNLGGRLDYTSNLLHQCANLVKISNIIDLFMPLELFIQGSYAIVIGAGG